MMKSYLKFVAFALAWVAVVAGVLAQGFKPPRTFDTSADVLQAADTRIPLEWYQAETIRLDHHALKGQAPFDLSSTNQMMLWEVTSTTDVTVTYIISTGTAVQASNGWFRWTLTPNQANLTAGVYRGWLRVVQTNMAGVVTNQGVLAVQEVTVNSSPDASLYDFVGPISGTGFLRRIYVNGVLQNSTNYDAFLNVSTNGGGTGSTEVVVSGDTNWLTVATVGVTNTVTPSERATNAMAEAELVYAWGDWRLGIYGASSSLFGTLTNGVLRTNAVTGTHIADGTISNVDLALNAVAGSNLIDGTVMGADIGTGTVAGVNIAGGTVSNAQLSGNAVAGTNLIDGTVMGADIGTGTVAGVNIAGGTVSNAHLALNAVAGSNIVGGAIGNQHMAASSVASSNVTDGSIGTNDAALSQWDGRYLMQTGGTVAGRATIAAAAQGTNALSVRNTQTPGAGVDVEINSSSSDYMLRLSRGTTDEYRFSPTLADFGGNDLVDVGGASFASITSGWFTGDGAGVTNTDAETLDGIDSTGVTTVARFELLNEAAIVDTNARAQRVLGDLHGASFIADQGVVAACTNCAMSTNMIVNGDMTQGGAYWTFTGGANSNSGSGGQLIVAGNTSGTAIQSNQFAATPGSWQISYTNTATDATGSITVAFGGVERTQVGPLTGYVSWIVGPRTTNGFSISASVTGSTAGAWKNFTLKQMFSGDVTAVYGSFTHVAASNATIIGNLTAGTISGNSTGYVARTGDTMTGKLKIQLLSASGSILFTNASDGMWAGLGFYDAGTNLIGRSYDGSGTPCLIWDACNDGSGSSLDADLVDGISVIASGNTFGALSGANLTNLTAANFAAGGTFAALNAANLTNLPPATSTNGQNSTRVSGATNIYTGDVTWQSGTKIAFSGTSTGPTASIVSGSIVSGDIAAAVWAGIEAGRIGTTNGSVTSAQIQDGAVAAADIAAGAVTGVKIGATNAPLAAAVKVLSTSDGGTNVYWKDDATGGGGAIGIGSTNTILNGAITNILFGENIRIAVTGDQAYVSGLAGSGGGGNPFTNSLFASTGPTNTFYALAQNVWEPIRLSNVVWTSGSLASKWNSASFGVNLPQTGIAYAAYVRITDGDSAVLDAQVMWFENGTNTVERSWENTTLDSLSKMAFAGSEDYASGYILSPQTILFAVTNGVFYQPKIKTTSAAGYGYDATVLIYELGPIPALAGGF